MRVAIIHNLPLPSDPREHWLARSSEHGSLVTSRYLDASDFGVLEETQLIETFLKEGGYETVLFPADDAKELVDFLTRDRPDFIFNCCETFRGVAPLEMNVAAIFEILGIPFTGSGALALGMSLNKGVAKALFQTHGVPTPRWAAFFAEKDFEAEDRLKFPVIVKPLTEDSSEGIDFNSIVEDRAGLENRVRFLWREFRQPALAEEFVDGREINVAVLAANPETFITLPISEIVFEGPAAEGRRVLTYEAKWFVDSPYYGSSVPRCPAELSPELAEKLRSLAIRACEALQLRDYARVDFRVRASDDAIFALEVNPNPDITFDSGFVRAALASGRTHGGVIREIMERARERALGQSPRS